MDLFKFNFATDPTLLERGEAITKLNSVMWIERYSEAGEFELQAQLSTGLREFLPLGTLISHADTYEVMIVENHEITEKEKEDPTLVITGRSFDTYLENRIVGMNLARASGVIAEYVLLADYTHNQVVKLINDHIVNTQNAGDALVNVVAQTSIAATGIQENRSIDRGDVYTRVREILAIDDLGMKTIRRNTFGVVGSSTQTVISIYKGVNRSATVIFSWKAGDLSAADYLFSNKSLKNSALVVSRYYYVPVDLGPTKYDRRMMLVDASWMDDNLTAPLTGSPLIEQIVKMQNLGKQALKAQQQITISQADISSTSQYQYRKDYNVGDLISLDGNFGQIAVMRVTEYAEIEDENGESGHPTLSVPGV
jgi:hypothetical protein